MSDFYSKLRRQRQKAIARAIGLDFQMFAAKHDRPAPIPYPFSPVLANGYLEDCFKRHYSELVERIYWQKGKAPRRKVNHFQSMSIAELYGDAPPKQQNIEIREIGEQLGLTGRHIRRIFAKLLKERKIPRTWINRGQWHPPVDEAVKAISLEIKKRHAPHTRPTADAIVEYVVRCRKNAGRLERELADIEMRIRTCESWLRVTKTALPKDVTFRQQHAEREIKRAYDFMEQVAGKKGWKFCRLFSAIYEAVHNGSKTPVNEAKGTLGLNHAAFYRRFTKSDIREILTLARRIVANPDWVEKAVQKLSSDEGVAEAFSEWRGKVPENELWQDTY